MSMNHVQCIVKRILESLGFCRSEPCAWVVMQCMTCNAVFVASNREQQEAAGRWLRQERERRGMRTTGALARLMGVSDSLVSRLETGSSAATDERAEQIAEAFGMDIIEVRRNLGLWVPTPTAADDDQPRETLKQRFDRLAREMAEMREEIERLDERDAG